VAPEHLDEKDISLVIPVKSHAFSKQAGGNPDAYGRQYGDITAERG
jgi:hypothetical protein